MRHLLRKKNTILSGKSSKPAFDVESLSDDVMFLAALMAWSDSSFYAGRDPDGFCEHAARYWAEAPRLQEVTIIAPWCKLSKHIMETKAIHVVVAVAWADRALMSDVLSPVKFVSNAKLYWEKRLQPEGRARWEPLAFSIAPIMRELSYAESETFRSENSAG